MNSEGEVIIRQAKDIDWEKASDFPSKLISLADIEPRKPRYLWDPYLRLNNLNVIRGDGGAGKTMVAFAIASAITTGIKPAEMPGIINIGQGDVIYYGAEDDAEEYAYRAKLCGCNLKNLHVIKAGSILPQLSDIDTLRKQITDTHAKMIIFDPIQAFLGVSVDMNRANEVRPLLDKLRAICRELHCTAVIIEHLNKATQQKALYRGIGTVDIINASRSTLLIGFHPNEQGMCVILQIKANAKYGQPIKFSIDDQGRFQWHGLCEATEDEVVSARRYKSTSTQNVIDPVLALVLALLEKYPDGWKGTASQLLAEGSALIDCSLITNVNSIGKRLPGIHHELNKRGFIWQKFGREHRFSKQIRLQDG